MIGFVKRAREETGSGTRLPWRADVADVLARWPQDCPVAALVSGGAGSDWSRWSILGAPSETLTSFELAASALRSEAGGGGGRSAEAPPFQRGLIGWIGYDVGRRIEPRAAVAVGASDDRHWPDLCLHRCDAAYAHDALTGQWWAVGDVETLPDLRMGEVARAGDPVIECAVSPLEGAPGNFNRAEFEDRVRRAVEYVHAGDVFQVNVARRLTDQFEGSIRSLYAQVADRMGPWMGALIDGPVPGQSVLSFSPELLWRVDADTRRIVTRPIKGTSPATGPASTLQLSDKDRAELTMIVDLMRNDLGRVCEFGTVRVREARSIERHGSRTDSGVWHGVATVEGRVRDDTSHWDLIRACFPAGSITGAPKIRAMQIIDELEPVRRGPYCGSVGYFDDDGGSALNVAIRTAAMNGESIDGSWSNVRGMLDYCVGAGIVSDSVPSLEWEETCAKAAGFQEAIAALALRATGACR